MASNALGRVLGAAQTALSAQSGTVSPSQPISGQADGTPEINPGPVPTNPKNGAWFKKSHSPHGSSGIERVAGALADKLHKVR